MFVVPLLLLLVSSAAASSFNISAVNSSLGLNNTSYRYTNFSDTQGGLTQSPFSSNNFTYQGVAIGGWLVLEPYITPSLFLSFNSTPGTNESDIPIDEYHFCRVLGKEEASARLQEHWSTFYNESDFAEIASYGLNMVRIPVGYWSFGQLEDDPYVYGAQKYLDLAIEWAHKYNLKVWVDLHGVPGSQNGFDNSGYRDIGYPGWFNKTENLQLTYEVLNQIYAKYGNASNPIYAETIIGIEVVNEPYSPNLDILALWNYYDNAYINAREIQLINNTIVFHDAFKGAGYWNYFRNQTFQPGENINTTNLIENYNILIDHHHYEVFTSNQLQQNISQHIDGIKAYVQSIYANENKSHPSVIGEWLAALTDCTPWLNGVGLGSRYEGQAPYDNKPIGSCANINNWASWNSTQKANYRRFVEIQLDQYNNYTQGWIFWCFKTETTIEWDFKRLVQYQLMPQPLSQRLYIVNGTDTTNKKKNAAFALAPASSWVAVVLALLITLM